jgi:hypothetical protein
MEFNLSRLKKLACMAEVMEEDDESKVEGDETKTPDDKAPTAKPEADAKAAPKGDEKAPPTAKPAGAPGEAKKPGAPAFGGGEGAVDPKIKAEREAMMKDAAEQRLDPNWIRASIKHLVDRAHSQVQTGDKNTGSIKAELQHHHDMMHANLKGLHRFPFANPAASNEDKQNATELFDLSSNLDKLLRDGLGAKKAAELDWLR